jgi:hypothetical protein
MRNAQNDDQLIIQLIHERIMDRLERAVYDLSVPQRKKSRTMTTIDNLPKRGQAHG